MTSMDRASLVRRRQQMREKENPTAESNTAVPSSKSVPPKKKKAVKTKEPTSEDCPSETTSFKATNAPAKKKVPPPPPVQAKRPSQRTKRPNSMTSSYSTEANAGLLVRQILQRSEFGNAKEFLQSTTKTELFQQVLTLAQFVEDTRKKYSKVSEAIDSELVLQQTKFRAVMSDLVKKERICEEQEREKNELDARLKLAQDEYQSLVVWIRALFFLSEHEDKMKTLQQTKQDQTQVIEEMSEARRQREDQLKQLTKEREQAFRFAEEMKEHNSELQSQTMVQRDADRLQKELKEENEANKKLLLEVQQKNQLVEKMAIEIEDARNHISTLQGQVQLEVISRHSITQERDRLRHQYQLDREEWKANQTRHDAMEKRKADEFRKMDLEVRHLSQAQSRLRIEWESEKSQREKLEDRLQSVTALFDETKSSLKALEEETQRLKKELNEEKETRTGKEHALQLAQRDIQALQKNCREQESAKLDAQSEVNSLVQRMKAIRRDHLALLHRVEAPTQLAAQWHAQRQENQRPR